MANDSISVIIADDDTLIRSVLRHRLEAIGQIVYQASNGLEAVELASQLQARLIMLDLNMPRLNGLLACQRIRQMPHHAETPIVILTSIRSKDAEDALVRVGATAFITKPFRPAQLMALLSQYLMIEDRTLDAIRESAEKVAEITKTLDVLPGDARKAKSESIVPPHWGTSVLNNLRK